MFPLEFRGEVKREETRVISCPCLFRLANWSCNAQITAKSQRL